MSSAVPSVLSSPAKVSVGLSESAALSDSDRLVSIHHRSKGHIDVSLVKLFVVIVAGPTIGKTASEGETNERPCAHISQFSPDSTVTSTRPGSPGTTRQVIFVSDHDSVETALPPMESVPFVPNPNPFIETSVFEKATISGVMRSMARTAFVSPPITTISSTHPTSLPLLLWPFFVYPHFRMFVPSSRSIE